MANRLTWQNVAAPDMSDALRGTGQAGILFDKAAKSFSGAMSGFAERDRTKAGAKAMDAAMQIGNVGDWDKMMASGGLESLGIRPDQVTPELQQFLQGYRDDLSGNKMNDQAVRRNDQAFKQGQFDYGQGVYDANRGRVIDGREDLTYKEERAVIDRGETQRLRFEEIDTEMQDLAAGSGSYEEAVRKVINGDYSPKGEERALAQLEGIKHNWTPDSQVLGEVMTDARITVPMKDLEYRERRAVDEASTNSSLNLYEYGETAYNDYSNVATGVADRLKPTDMKDDDPSFVQGRGHIRSAMERLQRKYPQLNEKTIGAALEKNITGGSGWWNQRGDEVLSISAASKELEPIAKDLSGFRKQSMAREREMAAFGNQRQQIEQLAQAVALARTRQDPEQIAEAEAALTEYAQSFGMDTELRKQGGGTSDPGTGGGGDAPAPGQTVPTSPAAVPGNQDLDIITPTLSPQGAPAASPPPAPASPPSRNRGDARRNRGDAVTLSDVGAGIESFMDDAGLTGNVDPRLNPRNQAATRRQEQAAAAQEAAAAERAAAEADTPIQPDPPSEAVLSSAVADPVGTLETVMAEAGMGKTGMELATRYMTALKSGRRPGTGEPLNPKDREMMKGKLEQLLLSVGRDLTGSVDPNDPIMQLVNHPDKWLK